MPHDDFLCRSCGWTSSDLYHGDAGWPECGGCLRELTGEDIDYRGRRTANLLDPYIPFYSQTADRQFNNRSEWTAYEKALEEDGCFVKGGNEDLGTPMEREARKNTRKYGRAYLAAQEADDVERSGKPARHKPLDSLPYSK